MHSLKQPKFGNWGPEGTKLPWMSGHGAPGGQTRRKQFELFLSTNRASTFVGLRRNSEEFEVGNGKNYLHPPKSPVFFTKSIKCWS